MVRYVQSGYEGKDSTTLVQPDSWSPSCVHVCGNHVDGVIAESRTIGREKRRPTAAIRGRSIS